MQVTDFQLRPKPPSIFTCYDMVVKWGASISIIFFSMEVLLHCYSDDVIHSRWKLSWAYGIGVSEWNHWSPRICMSSVMLYSVMSAQPAYDDSLVDDSDNFSVSEMTMLKFLAMTWHCSACVHVVLLKFTHKWKHKKAIFKLLLLWGNQTVKMTIRIISFAMFTANDKIQRKTRLIVWTVEANDILHHIMMSVQLS